MCSTWLGWVTGFGGLSNCTALKLRFSIGLLICNPLKHKHDQSFLSQTPTAMVRPLVGNPVHSTDHSAQSQYGDSAAPPLDPYSDAYNAPPLASDSRDRDAVGRGRSRSRSLGARSNGYKSPYRRKSPPPRRPPHAPSVCVPLAAQRSNSQLIPKAPTPSAVLGVFGLSIRTQERDLDEEFARFGRVEKVTIVYDQRVSVVGH